MARQTRQRDAIDRVIRQADGPLGPQQVHERAAASVPGLGIATVYRAINAMLDAGEIRPVELGANDVRYEPADRGHHHHFECQSCHRAYDLFACPGHLKQMLPDGFTLAGHEIVLHGVCRDCNEPQAA